MCRPAEKNASSEKSPSTTTTTTSTVIPDPSEVTTAYDQWIKTFNHNGFAAEIRALGKELEAAQGPADVAHLNKMIVWSNTCAAVGLLTAGFRVNLITIVALSLYTTTRWTMIAHHTCHGGYDKCHPQGGRGGRWSRFQFALGSTWRRFHDWLDWMMPEAWNVEHNNRHHYNLSELQDPDLVERNAESIRNSSMPVALKYVQALAAAMVWKFYYYAPNTYKELKLAQMRKQGRTIPDLAHEPLTLASLATGHSVYYTALEFFTIVIGPYLVIHFFLTPCVYYVLGYAVEQAVLASQQGSMNLYGLEAILFKYIPNGMTMFTNALTNLALAELVTNFHSFCIVVPNHAGDDMYRFRNPCRPFSGSFYLRQVIASVDMSYGNDVVDFMHGWLNYQIEHHLWPNLSMLQYQRAAPRVRALCAKYGVPYVQENSMLRVKKTLDIMVGTATMPWFPQSYEEHYLQLDAQVQAAEDKKAQ